jgi:hypothetical protein
MADELTLDALVFTADGVELGRVKKIEPSAFLVNAPKAFDYWLEETLVKTATAERIDISINQADLGAYKMDKPFDHNGFQERHADGLDPRNVQTQAMFRGGRSRL